MLETLGMTEEAIDCEIRATMDTIQVARTPDGMPLYLDRNAAGADRIMPVNRIKPHTCFKGPIESGLTKMAVVGFGKQPGAAQIHACGPEEMRNRLLNGIAALKGTGRLLGGVGSLESADGHVVSVRALTADEVGADAEIALTDEARDLVPPLPFSVIDVLIIEQGGKDISGTTLDPNVTGRFWVHGLADAESPRVSTIVLLGITEASGGNVLGIGFADFAGGTVCSFASEASGRAHSPSSPFWGQPSSGLGTTLRGVPTRSAGTFSLRHSAFCRTVRRPQLCVRASFVAWNRTGDVRAGPRLG